MKNVKEIEKDSFGLIRSDYFEVDNDTVIICTEGDVVLEFVDQDGTSLKCLIKSRRMQSASSYFKALLDPQRGFAEADSLSVASRNGDTQHVAVTLPHDTALSLGRDEKRRKHLILCQLLRVLHETNHTCEPLFYTRVDHAFFLSLAVDCYVIQNPPIVNDSLRETTKSQDGKRLKNCFRISEWKDDRFWRTEDEASCRKLIYAQQRLGLTKHIASTTRKLVIMGSETHEGWFQEEEGEERERKGSNSVIWSLPAGFEEIFIRRRTILCKISDCIDAALRNYVSALPQCRFGYGNSQACDIFQYGQTIRFLNKKGFVNAMSRPSLSGSDNLNTMYALSLFALIKDLRAMPSYQIDAYHQHCGIKKDIIPTLDQIENLLTQDDCIGICGVCQNYRGSPASWQPDAITGTPSRSGYSPCLKQDLHRQSSEFFLGKPS